MIPVQLLYFNNRTAPSKTENGKLFLNDLGGQRVEMS